MIKEEKGFSQKLDKKLIKIATISGAAICLLYNLIFFVIGETNNLYFLLNGITSLVCATTYILYRKEKINVIFWGFFISIPVLMVLYTHFFGFINASMYMIPTGVFAALLTSKYRHGALIVWAFISVLFVLSEMIEVKRLNIELTSLESILRIPNTAAALLLTIVATITFRNKHEEQRKELLKMNSLKEKLISLISHDLRSPINSLKGILALNKSGDVPTEQMGAFLDKLTKEVEDTSAFMDNMLHWVKEQVKGADPKISAFYIKPILSETIDQFGVRLEEKQIDLNLECSEETKVTSDPEILKIIFRNLISNSIKFVNKGSGEIQVTVKPQGKKTVLTVKDNGIGMNDSVLNQVKAGYVESQDGTSHEKGFGLGLQLVFSFAKQLDIEVKVESKEGSGTSFNLEF